MLIKMRKGMQNQKGFTLIELMVVIAIIGILAAIAIPKFTSASDSAKGAKIAADLRTIDSAIEIAVAQGKTITAGDLASPVTDNLAAIPTSPTGSFIGVAAGHTTSQPIPADTTYQITLTGTTYRATFNSMTAEGI